VPGELSQDRVSRSDRLSRSLKLSEKNCVLHGFDRRNVLPGCGLIRYDRHPVAIS